MQLVKNPKKKIIKDQLKKFKSTPKQTIYHLSHVLKGWSTSSKEEIN